MSWFQASHSLLTPSFSINMYNVLTKWRKLVCYPEATACNRNTGEFVVWYFNMCVCVCLSAGVQLWGWLGVCEWGIASFGRDWIYQELPFWALPQGLSNPADLRGIFGQRFQLCSTHWSTSISPTYYTYWDLSNIH